MDRDGVVVGVLVLGVRGKERGRRENMIFGGRLGTLLLFQGHSPGGATVCNVFRWVLGCGCCVGWLGVCGKHIGVTFSQKVGVPYLPPPYLSSPFPFPCLFSYPFFFHKST